MLFPVRETLPFLNAQCHFKFRKKPSANKTYMCHAITKLFQSQSLWYAFYFHNVLWLFIICISKPVGSRFG